MLIFENRVRGFAVGVGMFQVTVRINSSLLLRWVLVVEGKGFRGQGFHDSIWDLQN